MVGGRPAAGGGKKKRNVSKLMARKSTSGKEIQPAQRGEKILKQQHDMKGDPCRKMRVISCQEEWKMLAIWVEKTHIARGKAARPQEKRQGNR